MALWIRFERGGAAGFGSLDGGAIHVHAGDMFASPQPTGEVVALSEVKVATPTRPSKLVALVNNYREAIAKQGLATPAEPLYFLKAPSAYLAPGEPIRLPAHDVGKVIYEGEIGVVIGREARDVAEADADAFIFGYTCVNDVTALELIGRDPGFAQWTRAKSFDTFGPFGPVIATGLDPMKLTVRTLLKGKVRQEYPCSDMVFSPRALVSRISRDMTLLAGDVIACGTSLGVGVLRPGSAVEVAIDGIGTLANPVQEGERGPSFVGPSAMPKNG
jgi:2-keto-4-pentenoate hydratase/2-oxohepta-3-ene-1,7-dioic acid hydratase in catechol pathway